jgi:hypothetical protein
MPATLSILLLQGDAEAQLLADAEVALELVFPGREVQLSRAWMPRPDCLDSEAADAEQARIARDLLEQPQRLVILTLLPAVAMRAGTVQAPLSPQDAANALEPIIERLQQRGTVVALTTAFRHIAEPLQHRHTDEPPTLRELVRRTNLEVARLSHRTGCFVLDLDRALAEIGGSTLAADCFGGTGQAAELAVEEFVALIADALPDELETVAPL